VIDVRHTVFSPEGARMADAVGTGAGTAPEP
jgi:hypothetical protein